MAGHRRQATSTGCPRPARRPARQTDAARQADTRLSLSARQALAGAHLPSAASRFTYTTRAVDDTHKRTGREQQQRTQGDTAPWLLLGVHCVALPTSSWPMANRIDEICPRSIWSI